MLALNGKYNIENIACGDKSITHRALILSAIAEGDSVINNASVCRDVLSTASCLRKLGAKITRRGNVFYVKPIDRANSGVTLYCGNSGTTARLLCGLVAGLGVDAVFTGDKSLSRRPMRRVTEPLKAMGAVIEYGDGMLFRVRASALISSRVNTSSVSAQVKGALLIASLFTDCTTVVEDVPTRHHTENMLKYMGADIVTEDNEFTVRRSRLKGGVFDVPNDISSVIYGIALALCDGREATFTDVGTDSRRTGAIVVLKKAGADIRLSGNVTVCGEKRSTVTVRPSVMNCLYCNSQNTADAIDEIPLLAVVACCIKGRHIFKNVGELALKESNRISATVRLAESMGQRAYLQDGDLIVESNGKLSESAVTHSNGDHRIAMCGTVAGLLCGKGVVFGHGCVDVSCPDFYKMLGVKPMKFALLGHGIANSRSPLLMSVLALHHGICCTYDIVDLSADVDDGTLLDIICRYDGVNVTMPFKKRVARLFDGNLDAVNTVYGNMATSTDGYGITESLKLHGIDVCGKNILVIGCGGAGTTAVDVLLKSGANVNVINRTESKAEQLRKKYKIDCTLTDFYGIMSFVPPCEFSAGVDVSGAHFVFSAEYKRPDPLLEKAVDSGIQAIDGLEMLYFQGCKSFALWTGCNTGNECLEQFRKAI